MPPSGALRAVLRSWESFHPLTLAVLEEWALLVHPDSSIVAAGALFFVTPLMEEAFLLSMPHFPSALSTA